MLMITSYSLRLEVGFPSKNSPIHRSEQIAAYSTAIFCLKVNVGVQTRPSSHYFALEVRAGCVSHEIMSNGPSEGHPV